MNKKAVFAITTLIVIGIMTASAVQLPVLLRADTIEELQVYLPIVGLSFAPQLTKLVTDLVAPAVVTDIVDPGDGRLFIATRDGRVQVSAEDGTLQPALLMDIRDKVLDDGIESGLVGLAVHPDFAANGHLYAFYVESTGADYYAVVARYTVGSDGQADVATELRILRFALPSLRHHGGALQFGPNDGYLYVAVGDGGVDFDRVGNAQSTRTLLGKILRIDVNSETPYAIPTDNPFTDDPDSRGEIWALGLRNPWRFSFDSKTGDMYIGDVGENKWEEINFIPSGNQGGQNFGWSCREGPEELNTKICDYSRNYIDPIYTYPQHQCAAIVGGYVYRGSQLPEIAGHYLFTDLCDGIVWSLIRTGDQSWEPYNWGNLGQQYTTFGQRSDGELVLGASDRTIYQLGRPAAD